MPESLDRFSNLRYAIFTLRLIVIHYRLYVLVIQGADKYNNYKIMVWQSPYTNYKLRKKNEFVMRKQIRKNKTQ